MTSSTVSGGLSDTAIGSWEEVDPDSGWSHVPKLRDDVKAQLVREGLPLAVQKVLGPYHAPNYDSDFYRIILILPTGSVAYMDMGAKGRQNLLELVKADLDSGRRQVFMPVRLNAIDTGKGSPMITLAAYRTGDEAPLERPEIGQLLQNFLPAGQATKSLPR